MKVGSLFSGGGLGDLGFMMAGMEITFQIEIEDYCQKILKLRWPDVPKWRDIKDVRGSELPRIDLLTGGFPCTDISIANNDPDGIAGERSGLWSEQLRLICELRPKYALVENVPALLSRGFGRVLGGLAEAGYDAEWCCFPSAWLGTFHRRERVWILAYPKSLGLEPFAFQGFVSKEGCFKEPDEWKQFLAISAGAYHIDEQWKDFEGDICGDYDGSPETMERFKLLGNGQVMAVTAWIGQRILEYERMTSLGRNT